MKKHFIFWAVLAIAISCNTVNGQFQKVFQVNNNVYALANNGSYVYAGTGGSGLFRSPDNGDTWESMSNGIPAWYYFSLLSIHDTIYAGSFGYVYFSANNGTAWTSLNLGLDMNDYVYALAIKGQYIYAGVRAKGVYACPVGTTSWTPSSVGLPAGSTINDLIVIGNDIYAATGSGVYKSTNSAASWNSLNNGIPAGVEVNKFFYLTVSNLLFAGTSANVYLSSDLGQTWTISASGMPGTNNIRSFTSLNDTLYAGTYAGLFASSDFGDNWFSFDNGIPAGISVISMTSTAASAFAGTGGSIFRGPGAPLTVQPLHSDKFRVFPSSAHGSEYLTIEIPDASNEPVIIIYDICGKEIRSEALNQKKTIIDLSSFEKGLYLVRLRSNGNEQVRKFIKS
ncbi:MAG: T9SS type A sorting domain-containing protein [Bacteroidetes bacterium]|nr:T9SS type A sorting domain-containing protein [Bacteroidota bacterium]